MWVGVLYAESNRDISPGGFITQEFMALILCVLLIILWFEYIALYDERVSELQSLTKNLTPPPQPNFNHLVSKTFFQWQVTSGLLAFGFIWYTQFFWHTVITIGDRRYALHAFIIHGIWILAGQSFPFRL